MRRQRRNKGRTLAQGNQRGKVTAAVFRVMAAVQLVLFARPDGAARQMVAAGKVLAQGGEVIAAQVDVLQRRLTRLCLQHGEQVFIVGSGFPGSLQTGKQRGGVFAVVSRAVAVIMRRGFAFGRRGALKVGDVFRLAQGFGNFRRQGGDIAVVGGIGRGMGCFRCGGRVLVGYRIRRGFCRTAALHFFLMSRADVGAQTQRFFVSGADGAEAFRVAVGAVFADARGVGLFDGGFVAGGRDAEGLPAGHGGSG